MLSSTLKDFQRFRYILSYERFPYNSAQILNIISPTCLYMYYSKTIFMFCFTSHNMDNAYVLHNKRRLGVDH